MKAAALYLEIIGKSLLLSLPVMLICVVVASCGPLPDRTLLVGVFVLLTLGGAHFGYTRVGSKRGQAALAESERKLRAIFDHTLQFIALLSPDGMILDVNRAALDFAGLASEDVIGIPFWEAYWWTIAPETQERLKAAVARAGAGEFVRYEVDVLGVAGRVVTVDFSLKPVRNRNGTIVYLLPEGRDITERKQAEDALRESEDKFESITRAAQDAIIMLDGEGHVSYWNPAAERILAYTAEEALGRDMHLTFAPQAFHQAFQKGFSAFRLSGEGAAIGKTLELQAIHKDGHEFPIELSVSAAKLQGQWCAVGIMRDITGRKQRDEKLRKTSRALGALHMSNLLLTRATSEEELLRGTCDTIVTQAGYQSAWIGMVRGEDPERVVPVAYAGFPNGLPDRSGISCRVLTDKDCPLGEVLATGQIKVIENLAHAAARCECRHKALSLGYTALIVLPLKREEKTFGILTIYSASPYTFDPAEIGLLEELAGDLAYGITALHTMEERRKAQEYLDYMAFHDSLTGLPNRLMLARTLDEALALAEKQQGALAVLFIDLDNFKLVNDSLGHETGDYLLCGVARRARNALREADMMARQGGDEFLILLSRTDGESETSTHHKDVAESLRQEAAKVAARLIELFETPFHLKEHEVYISASIGISLFPDDGRDASSLLQNADSAMYSAKGLGRGTYQFYSSTLSHHQHKRLSIETRLHKAIEQKEFVLYYQPLLDLAQGTLVGVEALIRWHPKQGEVIGPGEFIQVAEESGLIVPIGEWVIGEACRQLGDWRCKGIDLPVAVNLSVRQCWQSDIVDKILKEIEAAGVPRHLFKLEVTESAMMSDWKRMDKLLAQFHAHGIRISLDDFGTGYSSLNRLKHLPISTLKIDKSFVEGIPLDRDNIAIVNAIIQMATSLGKQSLAEGIETLEQAHFLRDQGCEFGQGYYFSKPVTAQEVEILLKERKNWMGPAWE